MPQVLCSKLLPTSEHIDICAFDDVNVYFFSETSSFVSQLMFCYFSLIPGCNWSQFLSTRAIIAGKARQKPERSLQELCCSCNLSGFFLDIGHKLLRKSVFILVVHCRIDVTFRRRSTSRHIQYSYMNICIFLLQAFNF